MVAVLRLRFLAISLYNAANRASTVDMAWASDRCSSVLGSNTFNVKISVLLSTVMRLPTALAVSMYSLSVFI